MKKLLEPPDYNEITHPNIVDHLLIRDREDIFVNLRDTAKNRPSGTMDRWRPVMTGNVLIQDRDTGEVLVDKSNAINYENCSQAICYSLAHQGNNINLMVFGNGGSTVSGTGVITYFPPNVTGSGAQLYNETYSKVVDDNSPLNLDPQDNYLLVRHVANTTYSDVIVTCFLDYGEPSGQAAFDNATNTSDFIFDELGLKAYNVVPDSGLLLTHVIFNPVQKSLNRAITIQYTIRISLT